MIPRKALPLVRQALARQAAVVLIGPRQVGKTTLAVELGEETGRSISRSGDPRRQKQALGPRALSQDL